MIPLGREQSQFGSHRVMASDHPRIVNFEPTGRSSLQAIGGSIGKYSDRTHFQSAARFGRVLSLIGRCAPSTEITGAEAAALEVGDSRATRAVQSRP